jgi:hypothetical protein
VVTFQIAPLLIETWPDPSAPALVSTVPPVMVDPVKLFALVNITVLAFDLVNGALILPTPPIV